VVEVDVENTNLPEERVRVIWEVTQGEVQRIFREMSPEDIDPDIFTKGPLIDSNIFPCIPHPFLNQAEDYLDRTWTQTFIKINYQPRARSDEFEP
jgi:hypothetical protein